MVKVKDIMRKHVVTVEPDFSLNNVAKIFSNNKIGSAVIMNRKKPVGIVTNEDIVSVIANGIHPSKFMVKSLIKRDFITVSPGDDLMKVARKMIKKRIKRVPVINKGKLEGILTDKEILITTPSLVSILSEKLKARVEKVAKPDEVISGICERCEGYSDNLHNFAGRWFCEECFD